MSDAEEYEPPTSKEIVEAAETNMTTLRAAVQWHLSGADWHTIAQRFSFTSPKSAQMAVEGFEGSMIDSTDVEAARNKSLARYEAMLRGVWPDATAPFELDAAGNRTTKRNEAHMPAFDRARGLIGDIVRLKGLAAPAQLQLYMPDGDEIMQVVSTIRQAKLEGIAREADIFDGEVVEDEEEDDEQPF